MARILDISDGYTSSTEPTVGAIQSSSYKTYVDDAAFVTAKGSAAADGDAYYNTTSDLVRVYANSAWANLAMDSGVVHTTGVESIAGNKTFSNDVVVTGDFTVNGTTTLINTTNLEVEDQNILVNNGGNDVSSEGAGITVERAGTSGSLIYANAATSKFKCGALGTEVEIADISSVQTLSNKSFADPTTATKKIDFDISGATATKTTTLDFNHSDNRIITFPDETITLQPKRLSQKGDILTYSTTDTRLAVGTNGYVLTADSSATEGIAWIGTTDSIGSSDQITNLAIAATVGSNALTIAIKGKDGNDPSSTNIVRVGMRHATLTNGVFYQRTITDALSLVISSGSTLGHIANKSCPIYVYLIDNAGTLELAASSDYVGKSGIVTTTAEGGAGAADSATVVYSTTQRTSVPYRLVGKLLSTQSTAGTWAAAPTDIQLMPMELVKRKVLLAAGGAATGTVSGDYNPIKFAGGATIDPLGQYSTSTGGYTILENGAYLGGGHCRLDGSSTANLYIQMALTVNTTDYFDTSFDEGTTLTKKTGSCHGLVNCVIGDVVYLRMKTNLSGASYTGVLAGFYLALQTYE